MIITGNQKELDRKRKELKRVCTLNGVHGRYNFVRTIAYTTAYKNGKMVQQDGAEEYEWVSIDPTVFVGSVYADVKSNDVVFVRIVNYGQEWRDGNQLPEAWMGLHAWPIRKEWVDMFEDMYGTIELVNVSDDAIIMALSFDQVDEYVTGQNRAIKLQWGVYSERQQYPLPQPYAWDASKAISFYEYSEDDWRIADHWQVIIRM